jgi:NitT/TauT family transport system substrate-binding protein
MQFVNLGQAQIITAITSNNGDIAGVWAPNTYTLEERANAKYLCSGADANAIVPGALIVRADFAKERPEDVAKFLAVFLRGWSWAKANPARRGRSRSTSTSRAGSRCRPAPWTRSSTFGPTFGLDEQLKLMASRTPALRPVDGWFSEIGSRHGGRDPSRRTRVQELSHRTTFLKRVAADRSSRPLRDRVDKKWTGNTIGGRRSADRAVSDEF